MSPAYEAITASWFVKLFIYWGSWLVWPLLGWALWRLRRQWHRQTRGWRAQHMLGLLLLLVFIEARFVEPQLLVVRTTPVEVGFNARIAVIADYHVGIYKGAGFLDRVVDQLNAMELDAVLIAGDHLYEPDRPVEALLAPLRRLRHKTLSVPGNHDEQKPGPPVQAALRAALLKHGVVPVEYTHAVLSKFTVVGLGDRFANKDHLAPLLAAPRGKPIIVLVHNPDSVMALQPGDAVLTVSGHTHGGQIRIPGLYWRVIPCRHPFDRGLHSFTPVPAFVTSGLGEIGLPMRFLNPPVIDVLELR
jgi:uncharacterized protein